MDLFLDKEVFIYYLNTLLIPTNDDSKLIIKKIIDNPKNKFLLTKRVIEDIESNLNDNDLLKNYFHDWMKILIDTSLIDLVDYKEVLTLDYTQEIEHILNSYHGSLIIGIFLDSKSLLKTNIPCSIISQIAKPNLSWIISELAGNINGLSVRYFDFQSDDDIKTFFKEIFLLPIKVDEVYIFDRQCNLNHNCFEKLITRKPRVRYLTARGKSPVDNFANKQALIKKFGTKAELYLSRKENIHERRIILDSLIIESDDDFFNILFNRNTWKIDVLCCKYTATQYLSKVALFQKVL